VQLFGKIVGSPDDRPQVDQGGNESVRRAIRGQPATRYALKALHRLQGSGRGPHGTAATKTGCEVERERGAAMMP